MRNDIPPCPRRFKFAQSCVQGSTTLHGRGSGLKRSAELREMPLGEDEALFAAQGAVFVFNTQDAAVAVHPQVIDVFAP